MGIWDLNIRTHIYIQTTFLLGRYVSEAWRNYVKRYTYIYIHTYSKTRTRKEKETSYQDVVPRVENDRNVGCSFMPLSWIHGIHAERHDIQFTVPPSALLTPTPAWANTPATSTKTASTSSTSTSTSQTPRNQPTWRIICIISCTSLSPPPPPHSPPPFPLSKPHTFISPPFPSSPYSFST